MRGSRGICGDASAPQAGARQRGRATGLKVLKRTEKVLRTSAGLELRSGTGRTKRARGLASLSASSRERKVVFRSSLAVVARLRVTTWAKFSGQQRRAPQRRDGIPAPLLRPLGGAC
jgi:hypothetical protein